MSNILNKKQMTEEDIKLHYITPAIVSKWNKNKITMETQITDGKINIRGNLRIREKPKKADYILYLNNNNPIAIVEAKDNRKSISFGLQQAIEYAKMLDLPFAYSSNGDGFMEHDFLTGKERHISLEEFPTEDELINRFKREKNNGQGITTEEIELIEQPYYSSQNTYPPRYYQRIAINRTLEEIAKGKDRLLLVMATGTGKTYTAFQIVYRLLQSGQKKKILYLADRNILVDQTIAQDFAPLKKVTHKINVAKDDPTTITSHQVYFSLYQQLVGEDDKEHFSELFRPDFFDLIIVDEAHLFKNLAIFSKMNNVSGISSSGAKKSTDMQLKCQYISEINGGRGIVFATGTPISNTMCELYVMQQYLQKDALEQMGIYHFDSWATNFGEVTTALELTVEGSGFRFKSRFNKFTNLPELMNIFRECADVQTSDMLDLNVPSLRDNKYSIVESEPDWYVKQVMEDFVARAERIRNGGVDPSVDNFLKITHEARLLGTDARLLDADTPNNSSGKLNKVVENVMFEYQKAIDEEKTGCQLVFSDIGTPKSAWSMEGNSGEFDVYNYVKTELVNKGIPADEIAFIHDAKSDAQRDLLFKAMRTGKKKILIGSTDKCGTGVNVQTHLVAMHHIDCPWKPSSIEQREGRGIRQGNENSEVAVYRYVTKGTFDAYSWSLVENKQRFISQVMTSKSVSRTCEDIDEATLSYAEIKAVATGNPLIREKMELDNDVQRLKLLKSSYDSQRYTLQDNYMIRFPKLIKAAEEKLSCVREDIKTRDKELINNPDFVIKVGIATFTERVDGGTAMLEAISKCKTGDTYPIGWYHGFELLTEKNFMGTNYMILRGKTEYKAELSTSPVGNMVKLENTFNGLQENEDFFLKKIEQYQRDMESSKSEYEKPFQYESDLKDKLSRQYELNTQLDLENGKVEDVDLNIVEDGKSNMPESNVAEKRDRYHTDTESKSR